MTTDTTDTPLTLSDIAAEIGFELEETTPQDQPADEVAEDAPEAPPEVTEEEDPTAETDLSQDTDEEKPADDSDAESDQDKDDAEEEEEKAPVPEKLLKRIDKLTAKRREAEERAETLEAEVGTLRAQLEATATVKLAPTPSDPLADVETPEQLEERIATARKIRTWALKNLEGGTVQNAAGEDVYYEPAQVREYLANADEVLTEHAPKRQQWLAQRGAVLHEARTYYPGLFKPGTQEHETLRATVTAHPYLRQLPQLEMIVGDAIEGMKLRFARAAAAQKKAAAPKTESKSPVKASAPPSPAKGARVPAQDINTREGAKNLLSRGATLKSDDIAAFLEGAL